MKRLLVAVAINEEFKTVAKLLKSREDHSDKNYKRARGTINGYPVEVLMTSMGMEASRKAATDNIIPGEHGGVLVLGYCGGLSLTLKVGDTVVASHVIDHENKNRVALDSNLCELLGKAHCKEGLKYRCVPMITQRRVIETPEEKATLLGLTRAEAVDMESVEIVEAALKSKVKVAVVKVVVDDSETELPNLNDYFEKKGNKDRRNIAPVFVAQPGLTFQLSQFMKKANGILAQSIPPMIDVICPHWDISKVPSKTK
jgi:nucleoside phosphorylase